MTGLDRSNRLIATKRTILGAIDGNSVDGGNMKSTARTNAPTLAFDAGTTGPIRAASSGGVDLPGEFDGTDPETIRLIMDDIAKEIDKRKEGVSVLSDQALSEQQEALFLGRMKIESKFRRMTVRDFNANFSCNIIAEVKEALDAKRGEACGGKKRDRPGPGNTGGSRGVGQIGVGKMNLETPAVKPRCVASAPGTAMRTVKRGEEIMSKNGSPIEIVDEGDLVATVSKRRRGNDDKGEDGGKSAVFDINVGHGRYLNLAEPSTIDELDQKMKNTAISQLVVLQDQMASLMAKLSADV